MNAAVIVAAGRGTRMGLERNKVLAPLCGEPVIARTVRAFERMRHAIDARYADVLDEL